MPAKKFRYICPNCTAPVPTPDEVLYDTVCEYYASGIGKITPVELREALWGDDRDNWPKSYVGATLQYFWKKAKERLEHEAGLLVEFEPHSKVYLIYKRRT